MIFTIGIACIAFAFGWYCLWRWERYSYRSKLEALLNEPHPFDEWDEKDRRQER